MSGLDPIAIFLSAVIFTLGKAITADVVKQVKPLAKKALDQIGQSSWPELGYSDVMVADYGRISDEVSFLSEDENMQKADRMVEYLLDISDRERKKLIDLAYATAKEDHNKAMQNLVIMLQSQGVF